MSTRERELLHEALIVFVQDMPERRGGACLYCGVIWSSKAGPCCDVAATIRVLKAEIERTR